MGSQIDAVTGLPIVGASSLAEIDQIPLGVQVVPWDDLQAQGRPNRGPLYPDDIWTLISMLQGQNGINPDKPQTIYTDGQHNLRVAVQGVVQTSGGGGGSSPSPKAYHYPSVGVQSVSFGASKGNYHTSLVTDTITVIYGATWGVSADFSTAASKFGDAEFEITMTLPGHGSIWIAVGTLGYYTGSAPTATNVFANGSVVFPVPIDVAGTFSDLGSTEFLFTGTAIDFHGSCELWCGST